MKLADKPSAQTRIAHMVDKNQHDMGIYENFFSSCIRSAKDEVYSSAKEGIDKVNVKELLLRITSLAGKCLQI